MTSNYLGNFFRRQHLEEYSLRIFNKNTGSLSYVPLTVQLSSKVTFAHVSDASHTCSVHAPVWQKGAWHSHTSCCSFIVRFCACMDTSHVRPRCVLHTFQMRSDVTLELSCTIRKAIDVQSSAHCSLLQQCVVTVLLLSQGKVIQSGHV